MGHTGWKAHWKAGRAGLALASPETCHKYLRWEIFTKIYAFSKKLCIPYFIFQKFFDSFFRQLQSICPCDFFQGIHVQLTITRVKKLSCKSA